MEDDIADTTTLGMGLGGTGAVMLGDEELVGAAAMAGTAWRGGHRIERRDFRRHDDGDRRRYEVAGNGVTMVSRVTMVNGVPAVAARAKALGRVAAAVRGAVDPAVAAAVLPAAEVLAVVRPAAAVRAAAVKAVAVVAVVKAVAVASGVKGKAFPATPESIWR